VLTYAVNRVSLNATGQKNAVGRVKLANMLKLNRADLQTRRFAVKKKVYIDIAVKVLKSYGQHQISKKNLLFYQQLLYEIYLGQF